MRAVGTTYRQQRGGGVFAFAFGRLANCCDLQESSHTVRLNEAKCQVK